MFMNGIIIAGFNHYWITISLLDEIPLCFIAPDIPTFVLTRRTWPEALWLALRMVLIKSAKYLGRPIILTIQNGGFQWISPNIVAWFGIWWYMLLESFCNIHNGPVFTGLQTNRCRNPTICRWLSTNGIPGFPISKQFVNVCPMGPTTSTYSPIVW